MLFRSIDGLKAAKDAGKDFRMVFIGEGVDRPEIMDYAAKLGLAERCVFTGAVRDRELLRGYFSLADLFLFPSTYDTNGIVVREAAACSCGSVLIRGSCAAEGIDDGETGILIEENGGSMGKAIIEACGDRERLRRIGENAAERIYLSWDDAVARAYARYEEILAAPARKSDRAAFNQAFTIWLLRGTFMGISAEMEQAATIDGCNRIQGMTKVLLPVAAPGIVTTLIFIFINA